MPNASDSIDEGLDQRNVGSMIGSVVDGGEARAVVVCYVVLMDILQEIIGEQGYLLLDGGLSTELESQGHDLNHKLWSAKLLLEQPDAIRAAHLTFLRAGADCIITSSYQASTRGLIECGCSKQEAFDLIERSVKLASQACDEFQSETQSRARPVIAASIGPYGAYLADGSEYRGKYAMNVDELVAFHRERFTLLADMTGFLAIETVPSLDEAKAFQILLRERPAVHAWLSFSCRDGRHLADGSEIRRAVTMFVDMAQVVAIGANCCKPKHVSSLIEQIRRANGSHEIVMYPNRGGDYCAESKTWASPCEETIVGLTPQWLRQGARMIGGCCGAGAEEIRKIKLALSSS